MTFEDMVEQVRETFDLKKMQEEDATTKVVTVYCERCRHTIQKRVPKGAVITECPYTKWGQPSCTGVRTELTVTDGSQHG